MKSFEELVEEVYRDAELRKEFRNYTRLKAIGSNKFNGYTKDFPQLYSNSIKYDNYRETTYIKPALYIEKDGLNRNVLYLSSALFKSLMHKYKLEVDEIRKLREAVAERYEQEL